MYVEGTLDLLELIIMHPFLKPDDQQKEVVNMAQKAIIRYFPVFEKVGGREAYVHSISRPQGSATSALSPSVKLGPVFLNSQHSSELAQSQSQDVLDPLRL